MDFLAPVHAIDSWQQRHRAPALLVATIKKFGDDQAGNLAVTVAFYAFFSVFPLLLVFVTVLGYVLAGDPSLMHSVSHSVLAKFPQIGNTISNQRLKGDAPALIIGILLSLWSGSAVMNAMSTALEQIWEIPRTERANFFQKRLRAILLLVLFGVMFAVAAGASGVVSGGLGGSGLKFGGYAASLLLNFSLYLAAFHFLCEEPPGWRQLMPGAAVAAVPLTILESIGGVYVHHVSHSDSAYANFGLVLGILAWLHIITQISLYCAEFNTVLAGRRWPRSLFSQPFEQPDQALPLGAAAPAHARTRAESTVTGTAPEETDKRADPVTSRRSHPS